MRILLIVAALAVFFMVASFLAVYFYGQFAARAKGQPSRALPIADDDTALDRVALELAGAREGESGLVMLSDNLDAFAARTLAARNAGRSLDLMYYTWQHDFTGKLLAHEVIQAADRGVRVRLLLDDINTRGNDKTFLALDSHPNIAVRLFNPSWARSGALHRALEMALRAVSMTRRMHNKAWIADGRFAIVGGRNIGDAYFDAAEASNFRDLDLLLLGEAVQAAEQVFDDFWNSDAAIPIKALVIRRTPDLRTLQRNLANIAGGDFAAPYLDRVRDRVSVSDMIRNAGQIHWTSEAKIIADPPEKASGGKRENWLMAMLMPVAASSQALLEIISPYFIPGDEGVARLAGLVDNGVEVAILTNSLAATDVAAVHGAYAHCRVPLLQAGVRLFELQPFARRSSISVFGSKGASLHTKAFTVDRHTGFIGSFNFDPRSVSLNTEMGVLFVQPQLVAEMRRLFSLETAPQSSYRLSVYDGRLRWEGEVGGQRRQYDHEPEAGFARRLLATLVGLLPIHSQL